MTPTDRDALRADAFVFTALTVLVGAVAFVVPTLDPQTAATIQMAVLGGTIPLILAVAWRL